jgi:hypothetical protein
LLPPPGLLGQSRELIETKRRPPRTELFVVYDRNPAQAVRTPIRGRDSERFSPL